MANTSVVDLVAALAQARVLEPDQQAEATKLAQQGYAAPRALAKELIARGWITPFQANYLIQGRVQDLIFGPYVILDRLGEGGMGTVLKARNVKLGRVVALKIVKKEYLSQASAAKRFRREIQAASQLNHPNIVLALNSDMQGDTLYYSMEYIEGIDLRHLLKKSGPLPVAQACDYMRQAALGLQHAFERGLVHRDIKPSNLLVTTKRNKGSDPGTMGPWGRIKILDLGLARAVADADVDWTNTLTHAGAVVGTPDYIAPEQARDSRAADTRSDIYSLGCTFYQLLTGSVPYPGGTGMEKLFKHQLETPKPIRQQRPDVPAAVEAVILRMMAKKPEDRYQAPAEAAKALEPLITKLKKSVGAALPGTQEQEPTVVAHDPGAVTPPTLPKKRVSKFQPAGRAGGRRPFWVAVAGGVGGLILLTGLLFAVFSGSGEANPTETTRPGPQAQSPLDRLQASGIPASERLPELPPEAVAVLGQHQLRHWGPIVAVAFSPDQSVLVTSGSDRTLRIWDIATGQQRAEIDDIITPPQHLAFSSDSKSLVAVGWDLAVRTYDAGSGALRSTAMLPRSGGAPLGLSPDGRVVLLNTGKSIQLWDLVENRERAVLNVGMAQAAFAADGRSVITWTRNQSSEVAIWDTETGEPRHRLPPTSGAVLSASVSSDGRTVAIAEAKQLLVVDASGGRMLGRLDLPAMLAMAQTAFSPDGKSLALSFNGRVRLLPLANLQKPVWDRKAGNYGNRLTFSADGSLLAAAGFEPVVHLFDTASGKDRLPGSRFVASQVHFAADNTLMTAGPAGLFRWQLPELTHQALESAGAWQQLAAVSSDGRRLVVRGSDGISVWDQKSGERIGGIPAPGMGGAWAVVSSEGLAAAITTSSDRSVRVWDLTTFKPRPALQGLQMGNGFAMLALSADGGVLATAMPGAAIRLWDTTTGKPIGGPLGPKGGVRYTGLALSPDGKQVAAAGDAWIRSWQVATGQELVRYQNPNRFAQATLLFTPDGQTLLAWNHLRLQAWDAATGNPKTGFTEAGQIRAVAIARDGQLATVNHEGRLQVWDLATGAVRQEIQLPGPASGLAFAADGRHLATANGNGTVYILRLGQAGQAKAPAAPRKFRKVMPIPSDFESLPVEPAAPMSRE